MTARPSNASSPTPASCSLPVTASTSSSARCATPNLDYGTGARRRQTCRDQVLINRRTAPALYLGVAPIVRCAAGLALGTLDDDPADALD